MLSLTLSQTTRAYPEKLADYRQAIQVVGECLDEHGSVSSFDFPSKENQLKTRQQRTKCQPKFQWRKGLHSPPPPLRCSASSSPIGVSALTPNPNLQALYILVPSRFLQLEQLITRSMGSYAPDLVVCRAEGCMSASGLRPGPESF